MKVYEGEEILDNTKLEKNIKKCLKKHYKRTPLEDNEYIVAIRTPQKETKSKYFCTNDGEPILKSQEYNDHKVFHLNYTFQDSWDKVYNYTPSNNPEVLQDLLFVHH